MFIINHKSHKINSLHEMEESAWKNICTSCNHKAGRKTICRFKWQPKQRRKAKCADSKILLQLWLRQLYCAGWWRALCLCTEHLLFLCVCTWFPGLGSAGCSGFYKLKSPVPKDWSDAQNVVRRFWQNPTVPSIVLIVPARYTAVRKQQVTGNGGRIRTNRASKSRIYARFPAWQSWRWIAIPLIAQKLRSNCPHGGTCHGYKTLLHSSEATGPKFYTTAQFSVWGTKFLLLVKRSQTVCMRWSCVERICPAKTDGPTIMAKFICITPSTRCANCCAVAVKSSGHTAGAAICRYCIHQKAGVWKTQPYLPKTLWSGFEHRLQEIRLRNARSLNNEFDKYGNPLSWSAKIRR